MSGECSRAHASTTGANASLTSNRSMSPIDMPLRSSSCAVAGIGPVSIITGSTPTVVWSTIRARGVTPSSLARSAVISSTAAAPSEICDELPAVTRPSGLNAGLSPASASSVVSGRMPWSATYVSPLTENGTISRSKRPSSVARAASWCERSASSSSSCRGSSHLSAIISALEALRHERVALHQLGRATASRRRRST